MSSFRNVLKIIVIGTSGTGKTSLLINGQKINLVIPIKQILFQKLALKFLKMKENVIKFIFGI